MPNIRILHRHATALNLGDEALCRALANYFPPQATITEIVNEPFGEWHPGLQSRALPERYAARDQFSRLLAELERTDLVVIGGGDLILGYPQHYLLLRACRRLGVPVLHVGVGVNMRGAGRIAKVWSKAELFRCSHFWIRDRASVDELRKLGVSEEKITGVPDLVYSLDAADLIASAGEYPEWRDQLRPEYLVVSVRRPEGNSAKWGEQQFGELADALDQIGQRTGLQIVFLPFLSAARDRLRRYTQPGEDDEQASKRVIEKMSSSDVLIAGGSLDVAQALKLLAGARLTIGTRLHSLIFSSITHTPFVALSYNLKTEAFIRDLHWERFSMPIANLDRAELREKVLDCENMRESLRAKLESLSAWLHTQTSQYAEIAKWFVPRAKETSRLKLLRAWGDFAAFRLRNR